MVTFPLDSNYPLCLLVVRPMPDAAIAHPHPVPVPIRVILDRPPNWFNDFSLWRGIEYAVISF